MCEIVATVATNPPNATTVAYRMRISFGEVLIQLLSRFMLS